MWNMTATNFMSMDCTDLYGCELKGQVSIRFHHEGTKTAKKRMRGDSSTDYTDFHRWSSYFTLLGSTG